MGTRTVFGVMVVLIAGCGYPQAKLDEARSHVQKSLEVWQSGGKPDDLKSLAPSVEFHEALWNAGEKLTSFEVGAVRHVASDDVVRCDVRISVRNRKGKSRTENVTYDVALGPPVKIVNNPMP